MTRGSSRHGAPPGSLEREKRTGRVPVIPWQSMIGDVGGVASELFAIGVDAQLASRGAPGAVMPLPAPLARFGV
jgi:hypothetical protein